MKEKMTPHIIAVAAFVMFVVLGLACATKAPAPKPPEVIVYNPRNIPEDQLATLFISAGEFEVIQFNDVPLSKKWYQLSLLDGGMLVKIPAGSSSIRFHYYGGEYGGTVKNARLNFNTIAGRNYFLTYEEFGAGSRFVRYQFSVLETSQERELQPDEQLLFINFEGKGIFINNLHLDITLNKGTDNERKFRFVYGKNELRIIVPQGIEQTIDVELRPSAGDGVIGGVSVEPEVEPQRNFTTSLEPIKYSLSYRTRGNKVIYTLARK